MGLPPTPSPKSLQEIEEICRILEEMYGSPLHGNFSNPLDELIYIILSTRSRDAEFRTRFQVLKEAVGDWSNLLTVPRQTVEEILRPGGLGQLKTDQILGVATFLNHRFGGVSLDALATMSDEEALKTLTDIKGVADKVAKCVLMYSLKRQVLPVDVHVHRVAMRLGFFVKKRPDTSATLIENAFPRDLRFSFHVNAIAHSRTVCVAKVPKCFVCPLTAHCEYYKRNVRPTAE